MKNKILLVDDDASVLAGYRRQFRKRFDLETAENGQSGLELLARRGPFAVVISDMRMPGMDGVEFITRVRETSPDTVRMILTGNADLETCIHAVNEGSIFRFLTKPCASENMARAIGDGLTQYRLITSERELLEGTLRGCVRTLCDILSLMNPSAFSRGLRVCRYVRHVAAELNAPHFWCYEMAATLSQIGCIALPPEILARIQAGRPLSREQLSKYRNHPGYGAQILAEIPRLELVAQMISRQNERPAQPIMPSPDMSDEEAVSFGAQLLRIVLTLDTLILQKKPFLEALGELYERYGTDHPVVDALMSFQKDQEDVVPMEVNAEGLSTCMAAAEDITTVTGQLVVPKGQQITGPVRMHLRNCASAQSLKEPFRVVVLSSSH